MYEFHIKPIQQKHAAPEIAAVYKDIQDVLQIETVPLVFQYIANYERYFFYIWERMRANLASQSFYDSCQEVREFSEQAVSYMETPSPALNQFVQSISPLEQSSILQIIQKLDQTNLKMMLLMIGIRESIKGIYHAREILPDFDKENIVHSIDEIFQVKKESADSNSSTEITKATRMLAPLLGNNSLMISHYPAFFGHIANEMERLENTEAYLLTRVGLEHLGFAYIKRFDVPLNCSFVEFMHLTEGKSYVDEILYFLKDTFPSKFPHLVLTATVMKRALQKNSTSVVAA
jgi:hypothetical protein